MAFNALYALRRWLTGRLGFQGLLVFGFPSILSVEYVRAWAVEGFRVSAEFRARAKSETLCPLCKVFAVRVLTVEGCGLRLGEALYG